MIAGPMPSERPRGPTPRFSGIRPSSPIRAGGSVRTAALLLFVALAVLTKLRYAPPEARAPHADRSLFSAARARAVLGRVLGDGKPHPTGSLENARVRHAILAELEALGFSAQVESGIGCGVYGVCAEVSNVLAVRPGRTGGKALLLSAHYDSVPAGPGASDDGSGVAALIELARALAAGPPLNHPLVLLFTDGEEAGLIGARIFTRDSPLARDVGLAINLEARGTTGPSVLFEVSQPSGWLTQSFAGALPRPVTSSAAYSVYRRLPNDTDLSVLRKSGIPGLGFAFIDGAGRYHTPLDRIAALDLGSLQQQGDAALACLRAFDQQPLGASGGDQVFFDVLALFTLHYPEWLGWLLLGLGSAALALSVLILARRGQLQAPNLLVALSGLPLVLVTATALGFALAVALSSRALPAPFVAQPLFVHLGCAAIALLATCAASLALSPFSDALTSAVAGNAWWLVLGWAVSWTDPGASYLFVIPAFVASLARFAATRLPSAQSQASAWLAPVVALALLWWPVAWLGADAVGVAAPWLECLLLALVATPLLPLFPPPERRPFAAVALSAALVVLFGVAAWLTPPFSPTTPQRMSVAYHLDADSGTARWLVDASGGPVPELVKHAAGVGERIVDPYPWFGGWGRKALEGSAPAVELSAPELVVQDARLEPSAQGTRRHVKLEMYSTRQALALSLGVPVNTPLAAARIESQIVTPFRMGDARVITFIGPLGHSATVDLWFSSDEPVDALLFDHSAGLPEAGRSIVEARGTRAVPSQTGDVTLVSRHIRL